MDIFFDYFTKFKMLEIDDIQLLSSPNDFFNYLMKKTNEAKYVYMALLVLETGKKGNKLIESFEKRKNDNKPTLILIDKSRNLRNKNLVECLTNKKLWGIIKVVDNTIFRYFPHILNEFLSVYHLKAYIFDDEVCISGANLSELYYTNRIDRYFVIKNKNLVNYVYNIIFKKYDAINSFKFLSRKNEEYDTGNNNKKDISDNKYQTKIFSYTSEYEIEVLNNLFKMKYDEAHIATAYLNFTKEHINILKHHKFNLFVPSAITNTFNNFGFLSNLITNIYEYSNYITLKFLKKCNLYEFCRKNYTFHSKGIWIINQDFWVTVIGSSNYNQRSIKVDKECNWVIISNDPNIKQKFKSEIDNLILYSTLMNNNTLSKRQYNFFVKLIYFIFNRFI